MCAAWFNAYMVGGSCSAFGDFLLNSWYRARLIDAHISIACINGIPTRHTVPSSQLRGEILESLRFLNATPLSNYCSIQNSA